MPTREERCLHRCLLSDNWEQCTKFRGAKQSIDSDTDASFYVNTVDI